MDEAYQRGIDGSNKETIVPTCTFNALFLFIRCTVLV